jgi:hypothetical protein
VTGPPPDRRDARERQLGIYAAEDAALNGTGREFRHLGEVKLYLDELVGSDWWADRWFVDALLALVRERLGFPAYGALLAELRHRKVVGEGRQR